MAACHEYEQRKEGIGLVTRTVRTLDRGLGARIVVRLQNEEDGVSRAVPIRTPAVEPGRAARTDQPVYVVPPMT